MMFFPNYERVFFWQPLLIYLFFLIYQKRKRKEKLKSFEGSQAKFLDFFGGCECFFPRFYGDWVDLEVVEIRAYFIFCFIY